RRLIFELPIAEGQLFALEKFRGGDDLHLKLRFTALAAVRHYTQLAHHVDDRGAAQYYSRDDANMLLATATALVSSSLARQSRVIQAKAKE
ncbi:MAG: hypothetical protein ACOVOD_06545, partial [Rhodoferax sp.]